jgi:carbamoyl-phosphate synthase / aspartate carbamoyltransferase / dihydroorotase
MHLNSQANQNNPIHSAISIDVSNNQQIVSTVFSPSNTMNNLYKANLISVDHLRKDTMHRLFNLAHDLRVLVIADKDLTTMLRGKVVAQMFFEPSTRTQCSFSAATQRLGGTILYMDQQHSSVKKGETLEDSVRMMSAYSDIVVLRHPEPGAAQIAANVSNVPLINAGDGTGWSIVFHFQSDQQTSVKSHFC